MNITFDEKTHTYWCENRLVRSVTQILGDAGLIDKTYSTLNAMGRGQAIHKACELLDKDDLDESSVHETIKPYLVGYEKFKANYKPKWELIEEIIYYRDGEYEWVGRLDRAGTLFEDDWFTLIEIKTGVPEDWHAIQTAAYRKPLPKFTQRRLLYLKPNDYKLTPPLQDEDDFEVFLAAVKISNRKRKDKNGSY
jgi:hypothetical protein